MSHVDCFSVTESEIVNAIRTMDPNSSPGPDSIHPRFIKEVSCYLIRPLKVLFQACINNCSIPDDWKMGEIIPDQKPKNDPSKPSSYRPICLTSVISKLFEKIIHQVISHVSANNIMSKNQHGFLKKKSTTTNLLECWNDWTAMKDNKEAFDIIYIDLEKAFDTVVHAKLIYKLHNIGIRNNALKLLENYLSNRIQYVKVNKSYSDPSPVLSGIPQGTLLGPLFFIIYINDINDIVSEQTKIKLYADDSKLYRRCVSLQDCLNLCDDIANVEQWFESWQLRVNVAKTEILHVGHNNRNFNYFLNHQPIRQLDDCRDLGDSIANAIESTIDSEGFKGGTRGAPIMPRDAVSRTAHVTNLSIG